MGHLDETSARFFLTSVVGDWQSIPNPKRMTHCSWFRTRNGSERNLKKAKSFWLSNLPEVRKAAGMTESAK